MPGIVDAQARHLGHIADLVKGFEHVPRVEWRASDRREEVAATNAKNKNIAELCLGFSAMTRVFAKGSDDLVLPRL